MSQEKKSPRVSKLRPRIVVSDKDLEALEALAEAAFQRNPALADLLLEELARARVVPVKKLPPHVVALGRTVTYRDEGTEQEKTVCLELPEFADIAQGRISVMTPIGIALIGLAKGARFQWKTRAGETRLLNVLDVQEASNERLEA